MTTPEPAFDQLALSAEVERVLAGFECARLSSTVAPDRRVFVSGSVARAADVARVQAALQGLPQVRQVVAEVGVLEWPFCDLLGVVESLTPAQAAGRGPHLELSHASGEYREGEFLVVGATAGQTFDGYLYVLYVDNAGDLVHMLPSPSRTRNSVRAGQKVMLGTEASAGAETARQYEIVPPHGRGMVIALYSRRPGSTGTARRSRTSGSISRPSGPGSSGCRGPGRRTCSRPRPSSPPGLSGPGPSGARVGPVTFCYPCEAACSSRSQADSAPRRINRMREDSRCRGVDVAKLLRSDCKSCPR